MAFLILQNNPESPSDAGKAIWVIQDPWLWAEWSCGYTNAFQTKALPDEGK